MESSAGRAFQAVIICWPNVSFNKYVGIKKLNGLDSSYSPLLEKIKHCNPSMNGYHSRRT